MLMQATKLAASLHHGQYRKHLGNAGIKIPYIIHPLEVTKLVWEWGVGDEDLLSAAVCHDVLEDTLFTEKELSKMLSPTVAKIVEELTFIPIKDEDKKLAKARYIDSFVNKSIESLVIKLADRFCNVEDLILSDPKYAREYFHKADSLFATWSSRYKEVVKRFGLDVQHRIELSYERILDSMKKLP